MGRERIENGARGEHLAEAYLLRRGWAVLERNWRCSEGEVDLVLRDPAGVVVMCEVKARSGLGFGHPLEAITYAKVARLRRLAAEWARLCGPVRAIRVDAVGVLWHPDGTASVTHVEGVTR